MKNGIGLYLNVKNVNIEERVSGFHELCV